MQSNRVLIGKISKYKAIVKKVEFSRYAYWRVTYSVAPGVDLTIASCHNGIGPTQALADAAITLKELTGQEVSQ